MRPLRRPDGELNGMNALSELLNLSFIQPKELL